MAFDLYGTSVLNAVVQALPPQNSQFLLNRYFPQEQRFDGDTIYFDVANQKPRIAPFVSPLVAGKIVMRKGFTTSSFKPAYVKDKRIFDTTQPLKRKIGEAIGGSMSPSERNAAMLRTELEDQIQMLDRRMELMAAQALVSGKEVIVGDQYDSVVVDFGRAAGQTIVLTGGNRWGQAGINPIANLATWGMVAFSSSGAMPTDVIMTADAWAIFVANATVQLRLNQFRPTAQLNQNPPPPVFGASDMGTMDNYHFWVYTGTYVDDQTDVSTPILPAGTVIMASPQLEGYRAFGAIRDHDAGFQAVPYWSKSWVEKDPSVMYLLLQSAPLIVPYRTNATLAATVL
jgi:hypothetical protein